MPHIVKTTHIIIDLAGKLDWHVQHDQDVVAIEDTIKQLRNKISQVQQFIKTHEADK